MSLPKWAQREIDRLTRDVEYWKGQFSAGPADSDTFVWGGSLKDEDNKPLGKGPTVIFRHGPSWHERFDVHLKGDILRINGGDGLLVHPYSGNLIEVKIGDVR